MNRLSVVLMVLLMSGCSPLFSSTRTGSTAAAAAEAQRVSLTMRVAADKAEATCAQYKNAPVSFAEERVVGTRLATSFITKTGKPASDEVTTYLATVGRNLARYSARPDLPWTFAALENDTPSAYSTPGGYVFVTTGLLKKVTNEAQLAGVLSHEVANVVHKNGLKAYADARHRQCIAANTGANLAEQGLPFPTGVEVAKYARQFEHLDFESADDGFVNFLMNATVMVLMLGNDKDAEFENDRAALQMVAFAGYDASEYELLISALGTEANHPPAEDRVVKLKALRQGELAPFATGTAKPALGVTVP